MAEALYDCPTCVGTGSIESSDSTDESWWDCRRCNGTGRLEDRRRPNPRIERALRLLDDMGDDARRAMEADVDMRASYVEGKAVFIRQVLDPPARPDSLAPPRTLLSKEDS